MFLTFFMYFLPCNKKSRCDFDDKLKVGDVRYKHLTQITIKVHLFCRNFHNTSWLNIPGCPCGSFSQVVKTLSSFQSKKKKFVFEQSYISYGKRQKSCTVIVI